MKFLRKSVYRFKIEADDFKELAEVLSYHHDDDVVVKMIAHYRAFLIGKYAGYDLMPAHELVEVQEYHRNTEGYNSFIDKLEFEIDIDGVVRKFGHADYQSMQKAARRTINFLKGFDLYLSSSRGTKLKPMDVLYSKMPEIFY